MYCIGLTGGIASGKSTVAKIFEKLGAEIISADKIAREITTTNKNIIQKIATKFGKNILDENQQIKRNNLREIIFKNTKSRLWLENLLHPLIRAEIEKTIHKNANKIYVIEIPLLKKREHYTYLNHVIHVKSDDETKIQRLMQRDNCDLNLAKKILSAQPSMQEYEDISDTIIVNSACINDLENKIKSIFNQIII
jgi:dephospho-CoA kinase